MTGPALYPWPVRVLAALGAIILGVPLVIVGTVLLVFLFIPFLLIRIVAQEIGGAVRQRRARRHRQEAWQPGDHEAIDGGLSEKDELVFERYASAIEALEKRVNQ